MSNLYYLLSCTGIQKYFYLCKVVRLENSYFIKTILYTEILFLKVKMQKSGLFDDQEGLW